MKFIVHSLLLLFVSVLLTSCLDCADCSECANPANDQELCFRDNRDYYRDRREWRDDVNAYEAAFECKCR